MNKVTINPDFKRKHRLGTRKTDIHGIVSKYGKIDFGIVGKDAGKVYRNICYAWLPLSLT